MSDSKPSGFAVRRNSRGSGGKGPDPFGPVGPRIRGLGGLRRPGPFESLGSDEHKAPGPDPREPLGPQQGDR
jgi:hypothetical protein